MSTIFVTRKRWLKINPVFYLLLALFLILPGCGNGGVTHNPVRPEAEESTQAEESTEPEESSESEESTESEEGSGSEETWKYMTISINVLSWAIRIQNEAL